MKHWETNLTKLNIEAKLPGWGKAWQSRWFCDARQAREWHRDEEDHNTGRGSQQNNRSCAVQGTKLIILQRSRRSSIQKRIPSHPWTIDLSCTTQRTASSGCFPCKDRRRSCGTLSTRASPIVGPIQLCRSCRTHRSTCAIPTKQKTLGKLTKKNRKPFLLGNPLRR